METEDCPVPPLLRSGLGDYFHCRAFYRARGCLVESGGKVAWRGQAGGRRALLSGPARLCAPPASLVSLTLNVLCEWQSPCHSPRSEQHGPSREMAGEDPGQERRGVVMEMAASLRTTRIPTEETWGSQPEECTLETAWCLFK